jgi:hypothetical protein
MRFIKVPRDDIEGAVDEYPAALLRNTNPPSPEAAPIAWLTPPRGGVPSAKLPEGSVAFEVMEKQARLNPRFNRNGATHVPRGAKWESEREAGGPSNPRMLQPLFEVRGPDGAPLFVAQIARKPPPKIVLRPGEEVLVNAMHLAQLLRTQCFDCRGTYREFGGCQDPTHQRMIVGGLASALSHILDDGTAENLPLHPALTAKAELPVDGASIHALTMARVGGK